MFRDFAKYLFMLGGILHSDQNILTVGVSKLRGIQL